MQKEKFNGCFNLNKKVILKKAVKAIDRNTNKLCYYEYDQVISNAVVEFHKVVEHLKMNFRDCRLAGRVRLWLKIFQLKCMEFINLLRRLPVFLCLTEDSCYAAVG